MGIRPRVVPGHRDRDTLGLLVFREAPMALVEVVEPVALGWLALPQRAVRAVLGC